MRWKTVKERDVLFLIKYISFLETKTKLIIQREAHSINHERPSVIELRVICAAAGERKGGGSRLANHELWSHFVTTNREMSIRWLYNSWSRKVETQNTEVHELRDYTVFLPQCGKGLSFSYYVRCGRYLPFLVRCLFLAVYIVDIFSQSKPLVRDAAGGGSTVASWERLRRRRGRRRGWSVGRLRVPAEPTAKPETTEVAGTGDARKGHHILILVMV